jgi:type I restriction enzyme S subunit
MSPERFLERYGYLAEAPHGIAKLRELILQLAVRGRLVPQDPNDEPASVLLERIRAEKAQLVSEGRKGRGRTAALVATPDRPPPPAWTVCLLDDISVIEMGNSPPGSTYNESGDGLPLINGPVEFSPGHFGN